MKKGHAVARVTWTANREMVKKGLADGWSAKAIYDQNQPKLTGISYRQFVRYVNDLRKAGRPAPVIPVPALPPAIDTSTGLSDASIIRGNPGDFANNYDPTIDHARLRRLIGKPKG